MVEKAKTRAVITMPKPIVFNYQNYERLQEQVDLLLAENKRLKEEIMAMTEINTELKEALWHISETKDGTDQS